jgi:hypothetical protein
MKQPVDRRDDSSPNDLRSRKVFLLQEVAQAIGRTIHTARRRLKAWKAYRSYNNNGRYYALRETPQFDAHGLWQCQGVCFSRYGNLTETVVESICRSEAGLSAQELGDRLRLNPRSFVSGFARHPRLRREKHWGRFVYYAADASIYSRQQHGRSTIPVATAEISESAIVAILVEQLKHPQLTPEALSRRLHKKQLRIEPDRIRRLFAHHGLVVKKTPRSV